MKRRIHCSLVQLGSREDVQKNLDKACAMLRKAGEQGTDLAVLPEVFLERHRSGGPYEGAQLNDAWLDRLSSLCRDFEMAIVVGSFAERIAGDDRSHNTSVFLRPDGEIGAIYRKVHLFKAEVADKKVDEGRSFLAGSDPILADFAPWRFGLSICYDLRFPELYRHYSQAGATILTVPASFTKPTGEAHWEVLLRARAIENQCYVLAANQVGHGSSGIPSFGHSMIVDPWGQILACGSAGDEELVQARLDMDVIADVRTRLPALDHRRL